MLGTSLVPVWILIAGIASAGSMAVAIQPVTDEKIHIQDTPGKIQTNVPVGGSRSFSPLSVVWDEDKEIDELGDSKLGSQIVTKQKIVVNMVIDVSTEGGAKLTVDNKSDETQIILIKVGSPPQVIVDMDSGDVEIEGVVGHNEWLATVPSGGDKQFEMEVSTTDAGFYPIVIELERVG